MVFQQTESQGL